MSQQGESPQEKEGKKVATSEKIAAGQGLNFAEPKMSDKKEYASDAQFCVQCGRLVGNNPWMVECINGGEIRLQDGTEHDIANDRGYMGCWAVGNECAKAFEPNLLFKTKEAN